ncbi:hypothetical protein EDF35_2682 [Rathayibacter sp. PhB151]|uniref:hypothetical protein n=1 Tax=Rathayibacter sp. PhB151 TaxID=2485189 RepID=UPI0010635626|nr:hypothetical protein [Rathayibacter sp. PhB151]TDX79441.1 hypothetical protein EDF35_2682 [Rathayibacter sp. PhB151]
MSVLSAPILRLAASIPLPRSTRRDRGRTGRLSAAVAAIAVVSVLISGSGASAAPGGGSPAGSELPPASFSLVKSPRTGLVYKAWEVAPGIAVATQPSGVGGMAISPKGLRTQRLVSSMLSELLTAEPSKSLVEVVPDLLGASEVKGNRFLQVNGDVSDIRVLVVPGDSWSSSRLSREHAIAGTGSDSFLTFDPDRISSYFDEETGQIRAFSPTATFAHELYHSVQALAGSQVGKEYELSIPTPVRSGDLGTPGTPEKDQRVFSLVDELVTQGGPRGLAAVKDWLLSPDPADPGEEAAAESGRDDSYGEAHFARGPNPFLNFALMRATTEEQGAESGPEHVRDALGRRTRALDRLVTQHPTEIRIAEELHIPARAEYEPMVRRNGAGTLLNNVGSFEKAGPIGHIDLMDPLRSPYLRWETTLAAVWSRTNSPEEPAPAAADALCVLCDLSPSAVDGAGSTAARPRTVPGPAPEGPAPEEEPSPEERPAAETGPPGRELPGSGRPLAPEAGLADDAAAARMAALAERFGGEYVPAEARASVWKGFEATASELMRGSVGSGEGIANAVFAVKGLVDAFSGDSDALTDAVAVSGVASVVVPEMGPLAVGLGTVLNLRNFAETEDGFQLAEAVVGLVALAFPELGPVALVIAMLDLWLRGSDPAECESPGQKLIDAFQWPAHEALSRMTRVAAEKELTAVRLAQDQIAYRARFAQSRIVLDAVAQGYTAETLPPSVQGAIDDIQVSANEALQLTWQAGLQDLRKTIRVLTDEVNAGKTFTDFRAQWVASVNEKGGLTQCGSVKHTVSVDELPSVNTRPIDPDAYYGAAEAQFGSITNETLDLYEHAENSLRLFDPSKNALVVPSVDPVEVVHAITRTDLPTAFTTTGGRSAEQTVSLLKGTGTAVTFVRVTDEATGALVCGAQKVDQEGLWRCDSGPTPFQGPGTTREYRLWTSPTDSGEYTRSEHLLSISTAGAATTVPLAFDDLHVSGRTVTGTVPAGASVILRHLPPGMSEGYGDGPDLSDPVTTGADGAFTLTLSPEAAGGRTQIVAARHGEVISLAVDLDRPAAPAPASGPSVTALRTTVSAGSPTLTLTGAGWPIMTSVGFRLDSGGRFTSVVTDEHGAFVTEVTLPAALATPGSHTLIASDTGTTNTVRTVTIVVTG